MTGAAPWASAIEALAVEADLTISLGESSARLTGAGQRLVLQVDSPWDAYASVPSGSSLRLVSAVADRLQQVGLRVDVVSDRGALLSMGSGVRSRFARLGTSRALAFGSPTALLALAWPGAVRVAARHRAAAAGAGLAVVATGVAAVVRLVHRTAPSRVR
jgi:hypothetical protein